MQWFIYTAIDFCKVLTDNGMQLLHCLIAQLLNQIKVLTTGVEPARAEAHHPLKMARLPIPPRELEQKPNINRSSSFGNIIMQGICSCYFDSKPAYLKLSFVKICKLLKKPLNASK